MATSQIPRGTRNATRWMALTAVFAIAACTGGRDTSDAPEPSPPLSTEHSAPPTTTAPPTTAVSPPTAVTPVVGPTTAPVDAAPATVDLGGGATLTLIDPLRPGAEVQVDTTDGRALGGEMVAIGEPVHLTLRDGELGPGGAVLEFPVPEELWADGDPADEAGIATLDESTGIWTRVPVEFDAVRRTVRTTTTHFSWWAPWTWDWASIGARVNQNVGELVGKRADEPTCERDEPVPDWVNMINGVAMDAALVVRGCAEGEGDVLAVELVNNRPYGLVLTYGGAVAWGWHDGGSALDLARNAFVDALLRPDQLYLPPLSRASVGITRPAPGTSLTFRIALGRASIAGDVAQIFAEEVLTELPSDFSGVGALVECAAFLGKFDPSLDVGFVFDVVKDSAECSMAAFRKVANGLYVSELESLGSTYATLKKATLVGRLIQAYEYEWKLLDLYVDNTYAFGANLGFGFSVLAKAAEVPTIEATSPSASATCESIEVDDRGDSAIDIITEGASCDEAYGIIREIASVHDPWSMPPSTNGLGYQCLFEEMPVEPGEASRRGRYLCSTDTSEVSWTFDAPE